MQQQGVAIGVMARAPVPGEAKTRLMPRLGADGAAALQRELTLRALATCVQAAQGAVTLFTAGDGAHPFWDVCRRAHAIAVEPQRGADLGARMLHALESMLRGHRAALLIGTDCPALRAQDLAAAAAALEHTRMVFQPAEDGGYVLVGARVLEPAAFAGIPWGEATVMRATRAALSARGWRAGGDWQELPVLWDVDRPADLERAVAAGLLGRHTQITQRP